MSFKGDIEESSGKAEKGPLILPYVLSTVCTRNLQDQ